MPERARLSSHVGGGGAEAQSGDPAAPNDGISTFDRLLVDVAKEHRGEVEKVASLSTRNAALAAEVQKLRAEIQGHAWAVPAHSAGRGLCGSDDAAADQSALGRHGEDRLPQAVHASDLEIHELEEDGIEPEAVACIAGCLVKEAGAGVKRPAPGDVDAERRPSLDCAEIWQELFDEPAAARPAPEPEGRLCSSAQALDTQLSACPVPNAVPAPPAHQGVRRSATPLSPKQLVSRTQSPLPLRISVTAPALPSAPDPPAGEWGEQSPAGPAEAEKPRGLISSLFKRSHSLAPSWPAGGPQSAPTAPPGEGATLECAADPAPGDVSVPPTTPTRRELAPDDPQDEQEEASSCVGSKRGSLDLSNKNLYVRLKEAGLVEPNTRHRVSWMDMDSDGKLVEPTEFEADDDEDDIEMLPIWKTRKLKKLVHRNSSCMPSSMSLSDTPHQFRKMPTKTFDDTSGRWKQHLAGLILYPDSWKRLAWDILGLLMVAHDCILIPLQALDPPQTLLTRTIAWCMTIFWTLDVPGSFLVGFHAEGIIEMRLDKVAMHYMKTWWLLDLVLVVVDWTVCIFSAQGGSNDGILHIEKIARYLRILRLLRVFKVYGVVNELVERVQSEWCLIMIGIAKLLAFIMLMNHAIACTWYGIGTWDYRNTWVQANEIEEEDIWYRYLTSLHWSLTQFTPASMEVFPRNKLERAFTICIIIFAMVTFSFFVSTITNAMTQLRNLNQERNEQLSVLRRYFAENRVTTALRGRIWGCVQEGKGRSKQRVHENDVAILHQLPWTLRTELQEELYGPVLNQHPFFLQYGHMHGMQMRKIYQSALQEISLGIGQELFNSGSTADRMFFVISGVLSYHEDGAPEDLISFTALGQWLCEAVLWIYWKHTGQLIAHQHCELVGLDASKIQEVLLQTCYDINNPVKKYAKLFVHYFKKNPMILTDTWADVELLQEMALRAFVDNEEEEEVVNASMPVCPAESSEVPRLAARRKSQGSILATLAMMGGNGRRKSLSEGVVPRIARLDEDALSSVSSDSSSDSSSNIASDASYNPSSSGDMRTATASSSPRQSQCPSQVHSNRSSIASTQSRQSRHSRRSGVSQGVSRRTRRANTKDSTKRSTSATNWAQRMEDIDIPHWRVTKR